MSTSLLLCIIWIIIESLSYSPSSHLYIQVIFTFKSSSPRSGSSSLDLDHPSIWIISGASSLDLDHPSIWIISAGSSTLNVHGCYLMILLVTGSSIEPALFHARCRPTLRVGLFQHLYLALSQNGPSSTYI